MPRLPEPYRTPRRAGGGQGGFTLLELLLAVTILAAVAWMSLGVVNNNNEQVRFEDTRNRLAAIRRAIIGDTSRTVNGQPEVRGYVADMGELPPNLQALVSQNYCQGLPTQTTSATCTAKGGTWITQPGYVADDSYNPGEVPHTGLRYGWNGPYLPIEALTMINGHRFLDGWGNDDGGRNFGWNYQFVNEAGQVHLQVQSLGMDGLVDAIPENTPLYEKDYPPSPARDNLTEPLESPPPLIRENEYLVQITDAKDVAQGDAVGGLKVDFGAPASCWTGGECSESAAEHKRSACSAAAWTWKSGTCSNPAYETELECAQNDAGWTRSVPKPQINSEIDCHNSTHGHWRPSHTLGFIITRVHNGNLERLVSDPVEVTWDGSEKVPEFIFEGVQEVSGVKLYDVDTYLYQGRMAWGVFECSGIPLVCNTNKPFPAGSPPWKIFTYVPGTTLVPFERPINP